MRITLILALLISNFCWSQVKFSEIASSSNLNFSFGAGVYGGGISFVDYNNDGWDDLTIATETGSSIRFFKNNSGNFIEDTTISIDNITLETKQIIWVDFDNDNDKDLFLTSREGVVKLFQNNGNLVFDDISSQAGLTSFATSTWGASWGDFNNDGYLDIFLTFLKTGNTQPNALLKNNGNGTFTNVSISAGINQLNDPTFCAAFFDYNNDGLQDIFVTNHKYDQSYLYKNNGNETFSDVSVASGANILADGMSSTIGDYNNDGWFDIYVTNSAAGNFHLKNNGNNTFTRVEDDMGTKFLNVSWGAVFLDADNDSYLDLYVSGQENGTDNLLPSAFYRNNLNLNFVIPENIGLEEDKRRSFSNAIGDIDNDGYPEIFVVNENESNFLWKNESVNNGNNWLKIKLVGINSNKDGVGNKIEVIANGKSQFRYTLCGEGYLAQNSSYEFFGLSDATSVESIKVTWHKTGVVETIQNVAINKAIIIEEGNGILNTNSFKENDIFVSPNPSSNGIYKFHFPEFKIYTISVFDVSGRNIITKKMTSIDSILDLSKHAKGIYLVKMRAGNHQKVIKLIKQ
ncbi:VCBS repeat-containing protein [Polaribacter pectinis]|uniref:VCBS repeat-containing protein n=1 Tax=Polaribacter pectinis TaxID=2738844 RepID=A0A7G9LCS0_9FLAO|nr:FG-GAP-like repeat-containing protein [Polaribacter pectinis]QNM86419.1 VCBS repeat-containing protein [Polaribacter pectinis]